MNLIVTAATPFFNDHFLNPRENSHFTNSFNSMLSSYKNFIGNKVIVLLSGSEQLPVSTSLRELGWKVLYTSGTFGALPTAMLGLAEIIGDGPIFIAPGDSYVTDGYFSGMKKFCNSEDHGWVPTIAAAGKTWSYVRTTELNQVLEMAEKREISSQAATGVFGYKSKKVFLDSAKWAIKNNVATHNIYYVSSTVQAMLITGQRVYAENIQSQSVYRYFGEKKGREDEK